MKELFQEIKASLHAGTRAGHPYHFMVMGTVGLDRMARLRTVVLRKVEEDLSLWCYTDRRSKKVMHLIENDKVSLLFYDPGEQVQLKVEGLGVLVEDESILQSIYDDLTEEATKDYRTKTAPGSTVSTPEEVDYLNDEHHLCVIRILPFKIEYLRLGKPEHVRARFSKDDSGSWEGEYLVP